MRPAACDLVYEVRDLRVRKEKAIPRLAFTKVLIDLVRSIRVERLRSREDNQVEAHFVSLPVYGQLRSSTAVPRRLKSAIHDIAPHTGGAAIIDAGEC